MAKASWYETGYDGAEREAEKKALGYPPDRWWLRGGETKECVFVDDSPFCLQEHSWRDSDGRWHHETCIAKISDTGCPPCQGAPGRPNYTGHYTIIDISGYVSKDGTEHKYRLMLLPAKTKVLNKFKRKKENRGTLIGQLWNLTRADSNAPNTGDDLDHVREINLEGLYPLVTYKGKNLKEMIDKANGEGPDAAVARRYLVHHFQVPDEGPIPERIPIFNYHVLMEPKEPDVLKQLVADARPFGTKGGTSMSSVSADDVPF